MSATTSDRSLVTLVLVVLAALVLVPLLFVGLGGGPMMGGGGHGGGWGHGMWGDAGTAPGWAIAASLVFRALVLAVIVGGGYLAYRALTGRPDGRDPALEELRLAYARGDLSEEEYESRRERLRDER